MVQLFVLIVQFSDKVVAVPVVVQRQVPQFRSCSSSRFVDTLVIAQWLIPMVLTIEIYSYSLTKWSSSLLCRMCSSFCRRHPCRGAKAGSHGLVSKTIEFPPVAVHVVVDVPVMLWLQVPQVRMVLRTLLWWSMSLLCSSTGAVRRLMGCLFLAVYTGTRPGFPRHQGGEGVAGTPGACSQVFCHPMRCILGATLARHGAFFII